MKRRINQLRVWVVQEAAYAKRQTMARSAPTVEMSLKKVAKASNNASKGAAESKVGLLWIKLNAFKKHCKSSI
jgi:hypothetical protein